MDLRVDDEAMRSLVAKAVFDSVSPETRDKLLADAINAILHSQSTNTWEKGKSPLKIAFEYAVSRAAMNYADKMLAESSEFNAKLQALFVDVSKALFDDHDKRATLVSAVAEKIRGALSS